MKKTLTGLLALLASCTLLSACFTGTAGSSTSETSSPSSVGTTSEETTSEETTSESTSEETPVDPHAEALELAKNFVYGDLVEKDLEVSKDYTLLGSTYSFVLEEELTVSWTVDVTEGVVLTYDETNKLWKVDVDEFLTEDLLYTLTGTISDSDGHSISFTLDRKVLKAQQVVPEKITEAPVEGQAYKLYMYQAQKKNDLYFIGKMSGFYLATNNASKGEGYEVSVDVFVEKVEGKDAYYLTFTYENVKQYIGVANNWSNGSYHDNAILANSTEVAEGEVKTFEFVWSEQYGTLIATLEGVKSGKVENTTETKTESYFLGTSGSYYTFGACPVGEAAESYVGCLVKMVNKSEVEAEDKLASEKDTLSVTTAFSGAVSYELPTQGTTYGDVAIAWAVKSGDATLTDNVLNVANPTADTTIVLTATFTCGEASTTLDVEIVVHPKSPVTPVTEPKAGEAYAMYMYQQQQAKNYYFTGVMSGNYLGTTADAAQAADVYIEEATNGFKIYVMDASGAKSYITLTEYKPDGKNYYNANVSLTATGSVFTFNTQYGALCCKLENDTFFLTTYGDKTTMGASGSYYMDPSRIGEQYVVTFGIIDESALPPAGGEEGGDPIVPEVTTTPIATILASENGEYKAEGTVVAVTAKSFVLKDSTGMMLVYLNAAPSVNVGDKVTVKGTTSVYGQGKQFGAGSEVTFVEAGSVGMQIATSLTAADVDAYAAVETVTIKYIEVTATLSINASKGYYNLTVDGATAMASISYPTDAMKAVLAELDGKEISVEGYFIGVTGSSTKYVQIMAVNVRATDAGIGEEKPGEGEDECKHEYDKEGVCVNCGEACKHSFVDGVCEDCGAADPDYKPEGGEDEKPVDQIAILEAAYALAKNETLANQTLTGVIVKIDSPYSTQFSNITVTILVEEMTDMPMYCYRIKGEGADTIKVGDTITVTGTIKNYNGTIEFDAGSALTAVDTEAPVSEITKIYTEAIALEVPNAVKEAGEVVLATTGETYADVAISWAADNDCVAINGGTLTFTLPQAAATVTLTATVACGEASEEYTFAVTVSAAPSADTLTAGFVASQLGLANAAVFSSKTVDQITFTAAKNTGGTNPAFYTSGNALRLYGKNTFTISCDAGYKIVSIAITTETGKNGINDSNCTITNATATGLGTTSVLLTPVDGTAAVVMTNPASSGNFRIAEISVTYVRVASSGDQR